MRDRLAEALRGHDVDYMEIRLEEGEATRIQYRGKELEDINRTSSLGGNVRALYRGGWGFASFNSLDDLREKAAQAARQARLVGKEKSELAPVPVSQDVVAESIGKDPQSV